MITNLKIIYEDNHIIVVDKPAGIAVQGNNQHKTCLMDQIKEYLKTKYHKPGRVFLGLVHRLDQPVSGLIVFAKTSKAASRLSEQFRNHTVKKIYQALIYGRIKKTQGTLINYLKKDLNKNIVQVSDIPKTGFLRAELKYQTLKTESNKTLVEIELKTGRPHQIRAQFSHLGNPLIGDRKYGYKGKIKDLQLQSIKLKFIHPITKKIINLSLTSKFL